MHQTESRQNNFFLFVVRGSSTQICVGAPLRFNKHLHVGPPRQMLDDFLHGFDLKIASQDAGHGFGPDRNRETKRKKLTHKNWKLLLADDGGPSLYSEALATQLPSRTSPKLLGFEKVVNRERGDRTIANINKHKHFFQPWQCP